MPFQPLCISPLQLVFPFPFYPGLLVAVGRCRIYRKGVGVWIWYKYWINSFSNVAVYKNQLTKISSLSIHQWWKLRKSIGKEFHLK
jgi:hypothetical protein